MNARLAFIITGISLNLALLSQPTAYHGLMVAADYASNTNVLGNFSSMGRQPSYSPSVSFFSKWGADFSVLGYAVGNSDDSLRHFTSEMDLVLEYEFKAAKNLAIYPSYSHFFYSCNSNSMKSIFSDDVHLDADYTYKWADLGITAGYLFGQQHTFYAALHNFYNINFKHVFFRNAYLTMQPGIDANFGDYEYLNLYYLDELSENENFSNTLILYPVLRRYVRFQKLRNPGMTDEQILYNFMREKARDTFKFTSTGINLPVSYTLGNFSLNFGLYTFIPVNQPDYLGDDIRFFFDIGLTYQIVFK